MAYNDGGDGADSAGSEPPMEANGKDAIGTPPLFLIFLALFATAAVT